MIDSTRAGTGSGSILGSHKIRALLRITQKKLEAHYTGSSITPLDPHPQRAQGTILTTMNKAQACCEASKHDNNGPVPALMASQAKAALTF